MIFKNGLKTLLVFALSTVAISCTKVEELQKSSTAAQTALQFITTSLTPGVKNIAYSNQIQVKGGTPDYTFAVSSGTLPPGITMNSATGGFSGIISSTATGTYNFTVEVTDTVPNKITSAFSIKISTQLTVTTTALPAAQVGTPYNTTLAVTGGSGTYTFAASNLPAGLSLTTSTGVISGTPTAAGANLVSFMVTDSDGMVIGKDLTLTVTTPPSITTATLVAGAAGAAYSDSVSATDGVSPYIFSISAGSLPQGLSISPAGVISGTISYGSNVKNSPVTFTVQVTDSVGQVATRVLSIAVALKPWIPSDPDKKLRVIGSGVPYSEKLYRSGGVGNLTFSSTPLPAGLTLNTTSGVITGTTVAAPGEYPVTFSVSDSNGYSASGTKTLKIVAGAKSFIDMSGPIISGMRGTLNTGTFNAQWIYYYKMSKGDLNGDGFEDLAMPGHNFNRLVIAWGSGQGYFNSMTEQTSPDAQQYDSKVADFDGDGKNDVVSTTLGSVGKVYFWKGDNVWANNTITPLSIALTGDPRDVTIGDINNDGFVDAAIANYGGNKVDIVFNCRANPNITIGGVVQACTANAFFNYYVVTMTFAPTQGPHGIWLADMDNPADGKLELIVSRYSSGFTDIYKGVGDGTFTGPSSIANGGNGMTVRVGNIYGDANKEVVVQNTSTIHKVLNVSAAGAFTGSSTNLDNSSVGGNSQGMDVADTNADGFDDIATVSGGLHREHVQLWLGSAGGTITRIPMSAGYQTSAPVFGNFTSQGRPTLVVFRGWWIGWNSILTFKNNMGATAFSENTYLFANPPNSDVATITEPVFADLDRDGYSDVIMKIPGASSILKGAANGTLTLQNNQISNGETAAWTSTKTQLVHDFNGDGLWDYASVNGNGGGLGTVSVTLGNGDLTFGSQTIFTANTSGCLSNLGGRSLDAADVNLDGKADLIVATGCATAPGAQVYLFFGYGDGTFNTASPTILAGSGSYVDSVIAQDMNGDNFMDIIFGDQNGNVKVYRGTGAGTFAPPTTFGGSVGSNVYNLEPADLNNDGITDLVISSYAGSVNYSVVIFNSSLTVASQSTSPGATGGHNSYHNSRWHTLGDINMDGKIDILFGKAYHTGYNVLTGNNDGTFNASDSLMFEVANPGPYKDGTRCKLIDVNGDWLPDLICNQWGGGYGVGLNLNRSY